MKRFLFLFLALFTFAHSAFSADLVTIKGKTYATGFLKRDEKVNVPYHSFEMMQLPESYDARKDGFVTPIKNQGQCGSCWAFARTKALEAALLKAGVRDPAGGMDLAEQDPLVNDRTAYGCNGGFMDGTFEKTKGDTTEDKCPYNYGRTACRGAKFAKATSWAMIGQPGRAPTEQELKTAIYQYGVIAVTVAAGNSFSPNRDGRITTCGGRGINHMVTLVGYRPAPNGGTEYLIANSWGTSWGAQGYAWSKQGCNQLAVDPGDAALYFYVE